ncbi:MAG: L,D-transpeptidase [Ignavibacteriota bacterium]|jgi:murein L,D-transpeptidase YafK|nr:MAG: L,D-transpeptidase [Ignavibacterium sp.]MCO6446351.1 L,D-transpeptidase [Ignavibacterium album]MCZ2268788.1 L,D-transpeptidase [Ignavibacteriales bacterium]MDX9713697.1 L,D-transpeptidase [Ignavibacteriaceae bacterium]QKJ98350.1 MAG: L,D-transpeptidase [Ignavibacteriota bacterium]
MESNKENNNITVLGIFKSTLIRNILLTIGAIALFFSGVLVYGVILNIREIPLKEAMLNKGFRKLADVNIVVERKNYTLSVYEDTVLIKSYRASFGRNLTDKKKRYNDGATPVGTYKICSISDDKNYYKFVKINYPNLDDASDALRKSFITQKEFNQIKFEFYYEECVSYNQVLGGNIGIQGIGRLNLIFKNLPFVYNWTDGSIALSNEDLDEIIKVIKPGTQIVIK